MTAKLDKKDATETINFRLPRRLKLQLEKRCSELGIDRSEGLRQIIRKWMNEDWETYE